MALKCEECGHFDDSSTGMTVCVRHRRYTRRDWTCGDHSDREESDGPEEQAEDRPE